MKISELVDNLLKRKKEHGDIEVLITWEGIFENIENKHIYKKKNEKILLIDADNNSYKEKFAEFLDEGKILEETNE